METISQDPVTPEAPNPSTGPRTEEGKAISSKNALKHGLTASLSVLLPGEDPDAYRQLCEGLRLSIAPEGQLETALFDIVCDALWRLKRCPGLEAKALADGDHKLFESISRHEVRLKRTYTTTMKEVRDLIAVRTSQRDIRMNEALVVRVADLYMKRPSDLKKHGFVLSPEELKELDTIIFRHNAVVKARKELGKYQLPTVGSPLTGQKVQ